MSELPKGWDSSSLLDIVDLHDSQRIPLNQKQRAERPGKYPYYGANGFIFDDNYILLAEDGGYFDDPSRGVAYEVSGRFWVNNHAHILSPCSGIPRRFLTYALNSLNWMSYVGGSTRLKLTQESMRWVLIPVPPLNEQRRIVAKLDSLFARSRRARGELERIPKLCDRYKQAILAAACSGRLTADWREQNPDVETTTKLLEKVREERQKAFLRGKLRGVSFPQNSAAQELSRIESSDSLDIPSSWCWVYFGELINSIRSGSTAVPTDEKSNGSIPLLQKYSLPVRIEV